MNTAYLLLGGNLGDRLANLQKTITLINQQVGNVIKQSDIFVTAAWGNTNQPDFYNQAICVETQLSPFELLKTLLHIEEELGRKRDEKKWQARTIDIDILFFNNEIIDTKNLKIPHPYIQDRKFVLIPLHQIAKGFIHPSLNKNIETLLLACKDTLDVKNIQLKH
jgi:2-amino-4-hydroxy-6-hydroxymethyldihydropteridine diphosphokinase